MMSKERLKRLVSAQIPSTPILPYVHSTDCYVFREIVDHSKLIPEPCKVFKSEPLLYFFYGRPSYRVNTSEEPSSLEHYLPICLILKPNLNIQIKRIFPFDSGGFDAGLYRAALHRLMKLDDFQLQQDPNTAGKVVSLFFENVEDYLRAKPKKSLDLDASELEAISYFALISQRLSNSVDNRISAVEIQVEGELDIKDKISAIIIPSNIADSSAYMNFLKDNSIMPLIYQYVDRTAPTEYVSGIFDLCRRYYQEIGLI